MFPINYINMEVRKMGINLNFWKILSVVMAVTSWATKALEDGKVDADEAAELVKTICAALGVAAEITVPIKVDDGD